MEGGQSKRESLVVRIQPTGYQVFPEYDLGLQFRTMELLAKTDVPVPRVFWLEEERTDLLGSAFYVMDQVQGRVPTDNPPYHGGGWMTEISPEERGAIWMGGIECLARIHLLDYEKAGFAFLDKPELGRTALDQQIAHYKKYFEWARAGRDQPLIERAFEWVEANKPEAEPTCISWGDARIGNIIFDGTRPAAVLDWEMIGLGSPELDLGWAIFLDKHHCGGVEEMRLEGFPSYEESVAEYERLSGHRVRNLRFYEIFAGARFGVIMLRLAQQFVHYGVMDAEAGRNMELHNGVTNLLSGYLG